MLQTENSGVLVEAVEMRSARQKIVCTHRQQNQTMAETSTSHVCASQSTFEVLSGAGLPPARRGVIHAVHVHDNHDDVHCTHWSLHLDYACCLVDYGMLSSGSVTRMTQLLI